MSKINLTPEAINDLESILPLEPGENAGLFLREITFRWRIH